MRLGGGLLREIQRKWEHGGRYDCIIYFTVYIYEILKKYLFKKEKWNRWR